jgi:hypothetical protein
MMLAALTSVAPADVAARVAFFAAFFVVVRWLASNLVFRNAESPVNQGTKTVIVLHSGFQAVAAVWLLLYDPVITDLLRQVASRPPELDLANANSPGVAFLATVATGEFVCNMLHVPWWYEKKADLIMICHHTLSLLLWPVATAACRSHFFLANMLFYELSTEFLQLLHFCKGHRVLYVVVGTLFTLLFVLARLLTVPFTLYCVYLTWATWTAPIPASNPAASWFGPAMLAVEKVTVPLPILFNLYWGRLVVAGFLNGIGKKKTKPAYRPLEPARGAVPELREESDEEHGVGKPIGAMKHCSPQ